MRRRVVLDASAALEALLNRSHAAEVLDLVEAADSVSAPGLYAAEVGNALWKYLRVGDVTRDEAHGLLQRALDLIDDLVPSTELAHDALGIAAAFDHPVYDALYAVLARRNGASVCTLDRRLVELLKSLRVDSVLIGGGGGPGTQPETS